MHRRATGQVAAQLRYGWVITRLLYKKMETVRDIPAGEWRRVQKAEGYRWIMVNGQMIFEDGQCTSATPGRLLRHGRAS